MGGFIDMLRVNMPGGWLEAAILSLALIVAFVAFSRVGGRLAGALVTIGAVAAFVQIGHPAIPLAIAATGLALTRRTSASVGLRRAFPLELFWVLLGFGLYTFGRTLIVGSESVAVANGKEIVAFEKAIRMFFEPPLQEFFISSSAVTRAFNFVYSQLFLAVVISAILWLYFTDTARYRIFRNALGVSTALALVLIFLYPVAPPRLIPELGITDTVVSLGNEHSFANEFAAVPSLHVGWIALTGFVLALSLSGWRRWLMGWGPGLGMGLTVIVTGNHYWVDGVIGVAICLGPACEFRYKPVRRSFAWLRGAWAEVGAQGRRKMRLNALTLGGLWLYLGVAQIVQPGFTSFWGYLFFQVAGTAIILLIGEIVFAKQGGLSYATYGIAILCSFADVFGTAGNLYARIDEFDKLTHFLGTSAIAAGTYELLRGWSLRTGKLTRSEDRLYLSMAVAISIGVAWEVYEYLGDVVFHTARTQGRWDTLNDVISDSMGALTLGILLWMQERASTPLPTRDPVPEAAQAEPGPGQPPSG